MIGKQGWKLVTNQDTIISEVQRTRQGRSEMERFSKGEAWPQCHWIWKMQNTRTCGADNWQLTSAKFEVIDKLCGNSKCLIKWKFSSGEHYEGYCQTVIIWMGEVLTVNPGCICCEKELEIECTVFKQPDCWKGLERSWIVEPHILTIGANAAESTEPEW